MPLVAVSAAKSKVTIDGEEVSGLQSIDFKVRRRQSDVEAIGWGERVGVETGQVIVNATIRISSLNKKLDELLYQPTPTPFNLVADLKTGTETMKKITFDECFLDDKTFEMTANGTGLSVYNFTSTRVREE